MVGEGEGLRATCVWADHYQRPLCRQATQHYPQPGIMPLPGMRTCHYLHAGRLESAPERRGF